MRQYRISVSIKDKGLLFRTDWFDSEEAFKHALDAIVRGFPPAQFLVSTYSRLVTKECKQLY